MCSEKVFWYNYKDRGPDREFAEDHFGLIDHWGYPKPAYLAYVHMNRSLADKRVGEAVRTKDIWAYNFRGDSEDVIVAWSFPAESIEASLTELGVRTSSNEIIRITNAIGDLITADGDRIGLTNEPVFIHVVSSKNGE